MQPDVPPGAVDEHVLVLPGVLAARSRPRRRTDWFNKYAVQSVTESDPTGGAPSEYTSYSYSGCRPGTTTTTRWCRPSTAPTASSADTQDVKTFTGTGEDATDRVARPPTTRAWTVTPDPTATRSVTLTDSQGGEHTDSNQLAGDVLETTPVQLLRRAGGPLHDQLVLGVRSGRHPDPVRAAGADRERDRPGRRRGRGRPSPTAAATTWRKTETDTSYDATPSDANFGLPMYVVRHGDLSDPPQQTLHETTYAPANTGENLVGLPAEVETDAAACGGSTRRRQRPGLRPDKRSDRPGRAVPARHRWFPTPAPSTTTRPWPRPGRSPPARPGRRPRPRSATPRWSGRPPTTPAARSPTRPCPPPVRLLRPARQPTYDPNGEQDRHQLHR